MAFQTGVATDHHDLWTKLIAFLTTDPGLASEDSLWEIVASYTGGSNNEPRHILRGKGTAPDDNIYVGIARTDTPGSDGNRIAVNAMRGFNPNGTSWIDHIGVMPEKRMWTDVNPMKYWFVANSRRFIVVVNMSTVYGTLYAGFFLPYANPLVYTYPMFIGGTSNAYDNTNEVTSWRSQSPFHSHYMFSPKIYASSTSDPRTLANGSYLSPESAIVGIWREPDAPASMAPRYIKVVDESGFNDWGLRNTYTYTGTTTEGIGYGDYMERMTQCLGGGYSLRPFTILQTDPSRQTVGILDGVFSCPGVQNAAENIITIDGVQHLVVQNVWRATTSDYWALRLE